AHRGRVAARQLAPTPEAAAALVDGLLLAWPEIVLSQCGRAVAQRPRRLQAATCPQCGVSFDGQPRQVYCGRRCRNAAGTARRREARREQREWDEAHR